jgi:class 3 adenylate cyclase/GAF domain-containing protein
MNESQRADFVDLNLLISAELRQSLVKLPHRLVDSFGHVLSESQPEQVGTSTREVCLKGVKIADLWAADSQREVINALLEASIAQEHRAQADRFLMERREILFGDLDRILELSEIETVPFPELLRHFLRIVRAHVWVEKASLFGIYDGFTLEGLAGIGGNDPGEWKLTLSTLAGVAATTRKPYHSENPAEDSRFCPKAGATPPRNLLCFPLVHGNTLVGVLNLSDKIGGKFTEDDLRLVDRFANVAAHILQKHYFRMKMQSFERTSDHLGKYLSSKIVKSVKSKAQLELGGIEKKVVCLFADIRGYTTITEGIAPATLVNLLNLHFERMHAVIEEHEGALDKIVGDLVMAVWNIPNDQPEPELLAMKAALEMQKQMIRVVAPEWKRQGVDKVGMGIGVNSGPAVVGNLGSSHLMNFTVIGDTINTAQRLESKAKASEIWMAEPMFAAVNGKIPKPERKESSIRLKGKDKTIDDYVYRPLAY